MASKSKRKPGAVKTAGKAKPSAKMIGKAAIAGKARGGLPKIGDLPESTALLARRWIQCGCDADYFDHEVSLTIPGEVVECVVHDATGAARGCMIAEVLGGPSH